MDKGKIFRSLAILFVGLVAAFVVVANFSETKTILTCKGEITDAGQSRPDTLFAALNEYRWWVGLWSDSAGYLKIEMPDRGYYFFSTLKDLDTLLHIYNGYPGKLEFKGSYSKLSKSLKLSTPHGFFDGTCTAGT